MATGGSSETWHSDKDVYAAVRDFHDSCCTNAKSRILMELNNAILDIFEIELKEDCFGTAAPMLRYERTGSIYDGVKIKRNGLEFDIMAIIKGGHALKATQLPQAGHYILGLKENKGSNPLAKIADESGFLSAEKIKSKFTSRLQKIINTEDPFKHFYVKLVSHGPAVQMDIHLNKDSRNLYSVDMVPTFEVDGNLYVAKSIPNDSSNMRISYSLKEKHIFSRLDSGNLCKKQTLRVCKAILVDSTELGALTSYHLKNALLMEAEEYPDYNYWRYDKLAIRVLGVWMRIENCLKKGQMKNYFNRKINLLDSIPDTAKKSMVVRINSFCTNRKTFLGMIKRIKSMSAKSSGADTRLESDVASSAMGSRHDLSFEDLKSSDEDLEEEEELKLTVADLLMIVEIILKLWD